MSDDLVKRYREMQEAVGGCFDGHCVIKKPSGMHTNGGCTCLMHLKLHEASRVGQLLKYSQQMADRIEELDAKLAKAVEDLCAVETATATADGMTADETILLHTIVSRKIAELKSVKAKPEEPMSNPGDKDYEV